MTFLNNIKIHHVKYLLTIMAVSAVIVGFFCGLVSGDVFYATIGSIVTHFYQGNKVAQLQTKVEEQSVKIQTLENGETQSLEQHKAK